MIRRTNLVVLVVQAEGSEIGYERGREMILGMRRGADDQYRIESGEDGDVKRYL